LEISRHWAKNKQGAREIGSAGESEDDPRIPRSRSLRETLPRSPTSCAPCKALCPPRLDARLLRRVGGGGGAARRGGRAAGRGGFGAGGGRGELLGHHADGPARRAVADGVEALHGAGVLRLVVRVEEDDR